MNHKHLLFAIFILVIFYIPSSFSQLTFQITLANDTTLTDTTYEFDIYLKNTSADSSILEIGGIQLSFSYNTLALNGGNLKPFIAGQPLKQSGSRLLANTSMLMVKGLKGDFVSAAMAPTVANFADHSGIIEMQSQTPPGAGKYEGIYPGYQYKIGRYILVNSKPFVNQLNLAFDFTVYKVIIAAYIPGGQYDHQEVNTEVTSQGTFKNNLNNNYFKIQ